MREHSKILAEVLGCDENAIADTLFPVSKYTEEERISNMVAIFKAMKTVEDEVNRDWYEDQAGADL
ncbi:unnamed protein product [marine sediment metagenome]|uniref:Uncharacterized protein n=1 Tax=marine sediment metagenome TaxID=412755 RepID=X1UG11_9ZZZZ